jgi:hypothetical protein
VVPDAGTGWQRRCQVTRQIVRFDLVVFDSGHHKVGNMTGTGQRSAHHLDRGIRRRLWHVGVLKRL